MAHLHQSEEGKKTHLNQFVCEIYSDFFCCSTSSIRMFCYACSFNPITKCKSRLSRFSNGIRFIFFLSSEIICHRPKAHSPRSHRMIIFYSYLRIATNSIFSPSKFLMIFNRKLYKRNYSHSHLSPKISCNFLLLKIYFSDFV